MMMLLKHVECETYHEVRVGCQYKKSTAISAPTFIWRVRRKISKSTNHCSDYVCDVIWRQRLRASRGRLNLSAILPNRPADSRAKRVDIPGCWTLAFAFKALPVACFTADLLSIYFCAVRLICAVSTFMWAVSFLFAQFDPFFAGSIAICASWNHLCLVRFIFEVFNSRFGGSIYFCAVRFIFVQVGFICTSFDLYLRGSIDFLQFWLYVNDFRFIFDRLIMFVRVSFCLFCDLKILAVTERHTKQGIVKKFRFIFYLVFLKRKSNNGRFWITSNFFRIMTGRNYGFIELNAVLKWFEIFRALWSHDRWRHNNKVIVDVTFMWSSFTQPSFLSICLKMP